MELTKRTKEYLKKWDGLSKEELVAEERIINKYENDSDFIRCMVNPESENGDKEWDEITDNVGSLRYLISGEWHTNS